jgi:hypothetical protein
MPHKVNKSAYSKTCVKWYQMSNGYAKIAACVNKDNSRIYLSLLRFLYYSLVMLFQ